MDVIPPDDIIDEYCKLSEEKRAAVTNLMLSSACISVTSRDDLGEAVILDWQAEQGMSIHLLVGVVSVGAREFGGVWLRELLSKLSQMA